MSETNKPVKVFSSGSVKATIWENKAEVDGKETTFNTINVDRSYKDKEDKWKTTSNMRLNDLPRVVLVTNKAYEYLALKSEDKGE